MQQVEEQEFISELRKYVTDNFPLSRMNDQDLETKIEELVTERIGNQYSSNHSLYI